MTCQPRGSRVRGDPRLQPRRVEHRGVAVVGVLDEDLVRPEGQQVDEPVAVGLLDGRVHHQRPDDAVRRVGVQRLADELLPAQVQRGGVARPAGVEHRGGPDLAAVGQPHPPGLGGAHPAPDEGLGGTRSASTAANRSEVMLR